MKRLRLRTGNNFVCTEFDLWVREVNEIDKDLHRKFQVDTGC